MGQFRKAKDSREVKATLEFYDDLTRESDGTWQRAFGHMKRRANLDSEARLHKHLAQYLKMKYPGVRFTSNMEGERLAGAYVQGQRVSNLRSHRGIPDMMIFKRSGDYVGLAIELKKPGYNPYRKDGKLKADEHLREQKDYIDYLIVEGWYAGFGNDFEVLKKVIDNYMNSKF